HVRLPSMIALPRVVQLGLFLVGQPEQEQLIRGRIFGIEVCHCAPAHIFFTNLSAAAGAPRSSRDSPSAIEASSPLASRRPVSAATAALTAIMSPAASQ